MIYSARLFTLGCASGKPSSAGVEITCGHRSNSACFITMTDHKINVSGW